MRSADLLDLNEVLQHPGKKIAVDIQSDLGKDSDLELMEPVEGCLEAVSTGNLLLIKGSFRGVAVCECARCAEPLETPIEFEVDEQFPVEGVAACYGMGDYARVVPDEPYELFHENSLMVDSLLRQDLMISLPMQPLCQYGWDGPCPRALQKPKGESEHGRPEFQKLSGIQAPGEREKDTPQ